MRNFVWNFLQGAAVATLLTSGVFAQTISGSPAGVSSLTCTAGVSCTGGSAGQSAVASLTSIANHTVLANTAGSTATPISTTVSALIDDAISCAARGDILYRGTSLWSCLTPAASSSYFLQSGGAGADVVWAIPAGGGSGCTLPGTIHSILIDNVSSCQDLASLGTTTTVLHGNASANPTWAAVSLTADVTGTLPVGNGGTGQTSLTANGIVIGEGVSAVNVTAAMNNGQLLVGQTSADPLPKTLSQDCTLSAAGAITCTKTNNVSFATSATTDTTSATNITSGTLASARMTVGSSSVLGAMQCDNVTVTCAAGLLAAQSGVMSTTVSISSAQLLAVSTTPVTIVAAPGAGKAIVIVNGFCSLTYGTATYTAGTANDLYYGTTNTTIVGSYGGCVTAAQSEVQSLNANTGAKTATAVANQPVTFGATSNFATGDGTVKISVIYYIMTL